MKTRLTLVFLFAFLLCSFPFRAHAQQVVISTVSEAIKNLGDPDQELRDQASKFLDHLGPEIWPTLEAEIPKAGAEARLRIEDLGKRWMNQELAKQLGEKDLFGAGDAPGLYISRVNHNTVLHK